MTREQLTTIAIAGLIVTAVVIGALVYYRFVVKAAGRIKVIGLKVYADPEATKEVSAIDWGEIPPGGASSVTLYLESTSTAPATLTLETSAWDPAAAEDFMNVTWNYDGTALQPGEVRAVIFTLKVSEGIAGIVDFSFDITLTAAG